MFAFPVPCLRSLCRADLHTRKQRTSGSSLGRQSMVRSEPSPVGIRIGLDAKERLKADQRGLAVTYYSGETPPCLATGASPGQGTLLISSEKAPPGSMAVIVIRNRKIGEGLKYTVADEWLPKILGWNKSDPSGRYDAAMSAEDLFKAEPVAAQ
jgi:hypothetical protein